MVDPHTFCRHVSSCDVCAAMACSMCFCSLSALVRGGRRGTVTWAHTQTHTDTHRHTHTHSHTDARQDRRMEAQLHNMDTHTHTSTNTCSHANTSEHVHNSHTYTRPCMRQEPCVCACVWTGRPSFCVCVCVLCVCVCVHTTPLHCLLMPVASTQVPPCHMQLSTLASV